MLEAVNLTCERGERTLFAALEFAVAPGSLLRVAGPNGTGKTSLLRMLCGLLEPVAGEVRWHGRNIRRQREEYWRDLVYIGHLNGVKDDLTVVENLKVAQAVAGRNVDMRRYGARWMPSAWRRSSKPSLGAYRRGSADASRWRACLRPRPRRCGFLTSRLSHLISAGWHRFQSGLQAISPTATW